MIILEQVANKTERFYQSIPLLVSDKVEARREIPQSMFLQQLDPKGHLILNTTYYPNIRKEVPEKGH